MTRKSAFFILLFASFYSLSSQCSENKISYSIGLSYESTPGLLGNNGHIRLEFDVKHPNLTINTIIKPLIKELNTVCDYNPEKNNRLAQQIIYSEKRLRQLQELEMMKSLYDENDPDLIAINDMIKQMREKNGC